jgi:hypothetical protein
MYMFVTIVHCTQHIRDIPSTVRMHSFIMYKRCKSLQENEKAAFLHYALQYRTVHKSVPCLFYQSVFVCYMYVHTSSLFSLRVVNGRLHGLYQPPFGEDEILEGVALLVGLKDDLLHSGGGLLPLHHHRQLHRSDIDMACSTRFIHVPSLIQIIQ